MLYSHGPSIGSGRSKEFVGEGDDDSLCLCCLCVFFFENWWFYVICWSCLVGFVSMWSFRTTSPSVLCIEVSKEDGKDPQTAAFTAT